MMKSNNYMKGVLFCLIATLSWGTMFPIMTHALQVIDPFTFTAMRYTIAGITFVAFLYLYEGKTALILYLLQHSSFLLSRV